MAASLVGLSASHAGAQAYNPENLPAAGVAQVTGICRDVVGLESGTRAFDECFASLSHSAARLGRAAALGETRRECLGKGLQPGSPALAMCEVQANERGTAPTRAAAGKISPQDGAPPKSYLYLSWREAHQRQRMACAALGYDPAGDGFYSCVASLQGALSRAAHPST